jgi:hypothetical protein
MTECSISGPGLPVGGAQGQHLSKRSSIDFDVEWVDPEAPSTGNIGNVTGPDVSALHHLAWFTGSTGKEIADSGINADALSDRLDTFDEKNSDQDDAIAALDARIAALEAA